MYLSISSSERFVFAANKETIVFLNWSDIFSFSIILEKRLCSLK